MGFRIEAPKQDGNARFNTLKVNLNENNLATRTVVSDEEGNFYYGAGGGGTGGTNGTSGVNGTSGTSGTGFNTISNPALGRVLLSDGSTNSAIAATNLNFLDNSLQVTGSLIADTLLINSDIFEFTGSLRVQGGITGSLYGTSSWAENTLSASYVSSSNVYGPYGFDSIQTASFAFTASSADTFVIRSDKFEFTGSLEVLGGITGSLFGTSSWAVSASWAPGSEQSDTASYVSSSNVYGPYGFDSIRTASLALTASSADTFIIRSDVFEFTGSVRVLGSITGSLLGTASFAITASHALNVPITSSFALVASSSLVTDTTTGTGPYYLTFVDGTTGNRPLRVDSSTLTYNATTNVLTTTASFAISSSRSITSSFTVSASNAATASSADTFVIRSDKFEFTGSIQVLGSITGSLLGTASFATTASHALNVPVTSSHALVASSSVVTDTTTGTGPFYLTFVDGTTGNRPLRVDSNALTYNATTNVLITTASLAITASNAITASYALTSSFINVTGSNAFIQGGNSFGATATLGTNDNQNLALETNGTTRITLDTAGNTNIATGYQFSSVGTLNWGTSGYNIGQLSWNSGGGPLSYAAVYGQGIYSLRLGTTTYPTALFITASNGYVGINTDSPQKPLEAISLANDFVSVGVVSSLAVSSWTGIHFGYRESNNLYRKSAIVFQRTDLTENNAQGKIHILNGPQSGAGNATLSDAKITIAENGNVGISQTTPTYKLDIASSGLGTTAGNQSLAQRISTTTSNSDILEITNTRVSTGTDWQTAGYRIQQKVDTTFMGYIQFNGNNNGGISFGTGTDTGGPLNVTEKVRINGIGNVGIGFTSPNTLLDVAGGINSRNSRVDATKKFPIGHYSSGETVFEIDPTWTQAQMQDYFGNTAFTWNNDSTAPGGYCIQVDGAVNVGNGAYSSGFPYIPVDTGSNDWYYMECWIRNEAGSVNNHYMGGIDYNESFGVLGGNPGSFTYNVMLNYDPGTTWIKVFGYWNGYGSSSGGASTGNTNNWINNTKYFGPQALFNYTNSSGDRRCYISGWRLIKVNNPGNRYFQNNILVNGDAGIGTTSPAYKLDVLGTIRATGDVIAYSDARVKDNVETITDALTKVKSLRGVSYTRNDSEDKSTKIGIIAQEVLKVLPEVVQQDDEGKYSVAYGNMVGLLIEAIKEQQQQIEELKYLLKKQ